VLRGEPAFQQVAHPIQQLGNHVGGTFADHAREQAVPLFGLEILQQWRMITMVRDDDGDDGDDDDGDDDDGEGR
jgi:hypothetical protein